MSKKTFLIIDFAHMLNRAKFVARGGDITEKIGMTLHIVISSIKQAAKKYNADHTVVALEGRSWRKDFDEIYKANRAAKRALQTPKEKEDDALFYSAFNEFQAYLRDKTNCTVLQHECCEADDMISLWIKSNPNDKHVLISGDSDFYQLLDENLIIYDGVNKKTVTHTGVYDDRDKPIKNKKTKEPLVIDPEYVLFEKIIRGDSTDNVMSAYPGVRETKIKAAYDDRQAKGYAWNNFMLSRWTNHNGEEMLVRDRFNHNRTLIDLTAQPEQVKKFMSDTLARIHSENKSIPGAEIGFSFLKFCGKYNLEQIGKNPQDIIELFKKKLNSE